MAIPAKPRKCRVCRESFQPKRCLQQACSFECEVKLAELAAAKSKAKRKKDCRVAEMASRKTLKIRIEQSKPLSYWADKAQKAVNSYIRARDAGQPCISCGRHHQGKINAGHYRSRGAMAALRYHHDNIHLQCEPCNSSKAGNQLEYRIRLIKKIGIDRVEWLEGNHPAPHWKKDDYQRIEEEHKQLLRELRK
jgi:hypothetical protein